MIDAAVSVPSSDMTRSKIICVKIYVQIYLFKIQIKKICILL